MERVLFFELFPFFMTIVVVVVGFLLFQLNRRARDDRAQRDYERQHSALKESVSERAARDPQPKSGSRRPSMNP